jgi:hypothetical protein
LRYRTALKAGEPDAVKALKNTAFDTLMQFNGAFGLDVPAPDTTISEILFNYMLNAIKDQALLTGQKERAA